MPKKPKFYQAVLKEVKENVLDYVYPHLKGKGQLTMTERMGSEHAHCPTCLEEEKKKTNDWILLPIEGVAVAQGGKPYIECMHCGYTTHL